MANKIYIGDSGANLLISLSEDVSSATVHNLSVKKPNGTIVTWNATIHDSTYLLYTIVEDDLDFAGTYSIQPYLEIDGWAGYGETVSFVVFKRWS